MTRIFAVALISALLVPAAAMAGGHHQGTPAQQRACRSDVARFCRNVGGGDYAIADCLRANAGRLRPACRAVIESGR
jgi:hypothetical protein